MWNKFLWNEKSFDWKWENFQWKWKWHIWLIIHLNESFSKLWITSVEFRNWSVFNIISHSFSVLIFQSSIRNPRNFTKIATAQIILFSFSSPSILKRPDYMQWIKNRIKEAWNFFFFSRNIPKHDFAYCFQIHLSCISRKTRGMQWIEAN